MIAKKNTTTTNKIKARGMAVSEAVRKTPEPTAAETYTQRRSDIARLIDVLQMELDKHAEAAKSDPKNWGHAGDLGNIRSGLINLVGSMSSMDREEVEEFLSE